MLRCRKAVAVAQWAKQSLPTPEIPGSNPDIGIELFRTYICQLLSRKDENKEKKRPVMAQLNKNVKV